MAIGMPMMPMTSQNWSQRRPRRWRADDELAGRAAGHAEHLGRADQGRSARCGHEGRHEIDRADQGEDAAGALHEPADAAQSGIAGREQDRADRHGGRAKRHDLAWAELVHGDARDEAERRVAVVKQADQRGDADGVSPNAVDSSGTMTAGAERIEYW